MTNGCKNYGVTFPQINFVSRLLTQHGNIAKVTRSNDIQFDLVTSKGLNLRLICVNEYTCGLTRVPEIREDFPGTNIIYVGGVWNRYTMQAKEYCIEAKLGFFKSKEINGAIHHDDCWLYCRKDEKGSPAFSPRAS